MNITENKIVSLSYKLNLNGKSGELIETITEDKPLVFLFGSGNLLPEFENKIRSLSEGMPFAFSLKSEDAYGAITENAIVDIPNKTFEVNGKIDESLVKIGNTIPMNDYQGNRINGVVIALKCESVTLDFNHPLAGKALHFEGHVVEVRDATEEELTHYLQRHSGCSGCGSNDSCQDTSCGEENGCEPAHSSHNHEDNGCGCH